MYNIEIIYTLYLFFFGYFLILAYRTDNRYSAISVALAYPLSTGITIIPIIFAIVLELELRPQFVVIVEVFKILMLFFIWIGKLSRLREVLIFDTNWLMIVLFSGAISIGSILDPWITNDSAIFALYSKSIISGNVSAFPQVGVVSYGVFWAALNAAYLSLSGQAFSVTISFAFGLSSSIFLYQSTKILMTRQFVKICVHEKWLEALFWIVVLSTPMYLINYTYSHSNLISAVYLFFLFIVISFGREFCSTRGLQLILVFVFATSFGLARVENGLVLSIVLSILFLQSKSYSNKISGAISCSILSLIGWYTYIFLASIKYHDVILDPLFTIIIISSLIMLLGFVNINEILPYKIRSILSKKTIITICAFVLAILFVIAPSHGWISLKNMFTNLFLFTGHWGMFWWLVAIAFIGNKIQKTKFVEVVGEKLDLIFLIGMVVITIILALSFFRVPYRIGYGDSGNRLMVMAFPFFVIYLYSYMLNNFNKITSKNNGV